MTLREIQFHENWRKEPTSEHMKKELEFINKIMGEKVTVIIEL